MRPPVAICTIIRHCICFRLLVYLWPASRHHKTFPTLKKHNWKTRSCFDFREIQLDSDLINKKMVSIQFTITFDLLIRFYISHTALEIEVNLDVYQNQLLDAIHPDVIAKLVSKITLPNEQKLCVCVCVYSLKRFRLDKRKALEV